MTIVSVNRIIILSLLVLFIRVAFLPFDITDHLLIILILKLNLISIFELYFTPLIVLFRLFYRWLLFPFVICIKHSMWLNKPIISFQYVLLSITLNIYYITRYLWYKVIYSLNISHHLFHFISLISSLNIWNTKNAYHMTKSNQHRCHNTG